MEIPVGIELECTMCGRDLDAGLKWHSLMPVLLVNPCQVCIDAAHDRGEDEGWDKGYSRGKEEGQSEIE